MSQDPAPLADLEDRLGYHFTDPELLVEALTHGSYSAENEASDYERLEFLGDAVLGLATARMIYEAFPDVPEGVLTKRRASVVNQTFLASVGRHLGMPPHIRLGKGADREGIRERDSVISDVVESVLGAVFMDGGWGPVDRLVRREWEPIISEQAGSQDATDSRSKLQEMLARTKQRLEFTYEQSGPDHAVIFTATALVDGDPVGSGTGSSKKSAAIDAARVALEKIERS